MTRAFCNLLFCLVVLALTLPARAALVADPQVLYREMRAAYEKAAASGWDYRSQAYYLSTIFNAGRAYSLQRPNDSAYGELARATVEVASGLHYDPLINHDAVEWYVREAAVWVQKNGPPQDAARAATLVDRTNAVDDPVALARMADDDAAANADAFRGQTDVLLQRVEANWRGWLITHDPSWRSLAFVRANSPSFPLANLPTSWGPAFLNAARNAAHSAAGYTEGDRRNAQAILDRYSHLDQLAIIASVKGLSHEVTMSTLAPADEYFGPMGMSILGMRNELHRLNANLDLGWGDRESSSAVELAVAVDDLHKVYPRDRDLPQLLLQTIQLLNRLHTKDAAAAGAHLRGVLTVEYQDSPQARSLLDQG